jgi:hypothetical protein
LDEEADDVDGNEDWMGEVEVGSGCVIELGVGVTVAPEKYSSSRECDSLTCTTLESLTADVELAVMSSLV